MQKTTEPAESPVVGERTYGQILKSSALIGSSSVLNIAIAIVRTKAMALLLGPSGFGLFGIYGSIANLSECVAGMGIHSSGVRQIAYAVSSNDSDRVAQTVVALRRTSILLGVLGTVLLVVFSHQASTLTFGNDRHAGAISLLSVVVFFHLVSDGQSALIQGVRKILDLAKVGVLGALFGTLLSISVVYFLRERGVVPSIVGVALVSLIFSWWYSRKVRISTPSMTVTQVWQEASSLLKLGFAFMASGLMTVGVAYVVRIIVLRDVGFEATGFYQSAWALGGLYVGFILEAMGADFYPRLTSSADDNAECNRLVNEQTHVGLLLAGPGVIATLTLAPVVIALFYSAKFGPAVEVLRWICLGAIVQVMTWPLGYMILAKAKQAIYFGCELSLGVVSVSLAWIFVKWFGLNGAGYAFFGSTIFYGFLLFPIGRGLSGFRWSAANKKTAIVLFSLIASVFSGFYFLPTLWATAFGTLAALLSAVYSIRVLARLVTPDRIPQSVRRFLVRLHLVRLEETREG